MTPSWSCRSLRVDVPPDPLAFLDGPGARSGPRFFWSAWDDPCVVAATGRSVEAVAFGPDRLAVIARRIAGTVFDPAVLVPDRDSTASAARVVPTAPALPAALTARVAPGGPRPAAADPSAPTWATARWVGGFGFADGEAEGWDGFPPAWFWVPERMLVVRGRDAWLTLVAPSDAIDRAVREARDAIAAAGGSVAPGDAECDAGPTDDAVRTSGAVALRDGALKRAAPTRGDRPSVAAASRGERDAGDGSSAQPDSALTERIARAIEAVRAGRADKVVVATARRQRFDAAPDAVAVLSQLRALQPGCTHFLVAPSEGVALVGATPERLLRVDGERVETMALAGTAPRSALPAADAAMGRALVASAKDRDEHAHVVRAIRAALGDCRLSEDPEPDLRRLATVQHLQTRLVGLRPDGASALELAARLHPTPALGGVPAREALGLIAEIEADARGWYGGAVGWLGPGGDGDLAVVIRALLLQDRLVTAFAGAGIVAASDPGREAAEIEWKLAAALEAVGDG